MVCCQQFGPGLYEDSFTPQTEQVRSVSAGRFWSLWFAAACPLSLAIEVPPETDKPAQGPFHLT
jgi:hypothetical protein